MIAAVAAATAAPVVVAAVAAAAAPPVVVAAVAGNLLLLLLLRWLLLLRLLCCRVLPLPAGGGAVTGADNVAIDCRYGPCKSSVSVMKISKRIKIKIKNIPGTQDTDASRVLHSHPTIAATPLPPACR